MPGRSLPFREESLNSIVRKGISIILLGIWLFNILGGVGYFLMQLHYQKRTMHELLAKTPKERLTRIQLTVSELELARYETNELLLNGRMFDLAFEIRKGNEVIVYGLFDNDEDMLLCSLREQSKKLTDCPASTNAVVQFLSLSFLAEAFEAIGGPGFCITLSRDIRSCIYINSDLENPDQPPEALA